MTRRKSLIHSFNCHFLKLWFEPNHLTTIISYDTPPIYITHECEYSIYINTCIRLLFRILAFACSRFVDRVTDNSVRVYVCWVRRNASTRFYLSIAEWIHRLTNGWVLTIKARGEIGLSTMMLQSFPFFAWISSRISVTYECASPTEPVSTSSTEHLRRLPMRS